MKRFLGLTLFGACACVALITGYAAAADNPIWGWRGDGTGAYPNATPVTEWGPDKNVIWKTPLPARSNASPIIIGDKIFICAEKDTLICVSKTDGKILWSKANDLRGIFTDDEWKVVEKRRAELAALRKDHADATQKVNGLSQKIQFSTQAARDKNEDGRKRQHEQQIAGLLKQADDLDTRARLSTQAARDENEAARRKDYDIQAAEAAKLGKALPAFKPLNYGPIPTEKDLAQWKKQASDIRAQADKLKTTGIKPLEYGPIPAADEVAQMQKDVADLKTSIPRLAAQIATYRDLFNASADGTNGYSTMTPVTDGTHVYVLYGTGVAACYDLEGNRKWAVNVGPSPDGYGQAASPCLIGDRLIIHVERVKALDKATGKVAWESEVMGAKYGGPMRALLGGQEVALTANGVAIRASDGKVAAKGLGDLNYSAPLVQDGVVYYMDAKTFAWQLPLSESDTAPKKLWSGAIANERYYASSVVAKGVVYAIMQFSTATAVDATNGKTIWEKKLDLGQGVLYPSIAAAGDYVFLNHSSGQTIVIKAGREFEQVAHNTLEPFRSCPVFEGGRMYIRTLGNLYCIGKP